MTGRLRRRAGSGDQGHDEGPFVSFTDLFIGILFLFLILVAALMLMHQEAVEKARAEALIYEARIKKLQDELDSLAKLDASHPPYRLALVYNSFQKQGNQKDWTYSRTVQVYRAPSGVCLENVIMRNNLSLGWMPPVESKDVPNAANQAFAKMGTPCKLSPNGERWNSDAETGGVQRVGAMLYSGSTVLHTKAGDKKVDMQYRILGIYDDYYRR